MTTASGLVFVAIALAAVATSLPEVGAERSVEILDREENQFESAQLAHIICKETEPDVTKQIGRVDSITKLRVYFEHLPKWHEFVACKELHFAAIKLLEEIVTRSNENVCSDEKISLIEKFHVKFVSTASEHRSARSEANLELAPHKLQVFFWHYALEVDAMCKRNLIGNLEWDLKEQFPDVPELRLDKNSFSQANPVIWRLFFAAGHVLTELNVGDFDDVVTFWSLIGQSYISPNNTEKLPKTWLDDDTFDSLTGEPIRMFVKLSDAKVINRFKRLCHTKFRPIYDKLIMPIVRLSNLGYANNGEQFQRELDELRHNECVRRWYQITQMCDAALPVKFYSDASLKAGQVVMIAREEGAQLEAVQADAEQGENERPLVYEPATNSLYGVQRIESVFSSENLKLIGRLKLSETARSRIFARAVKRVLSNTFKALKSKIATVFVSTHTVREPPEIQMTNLSTSTHGPSAKKDDKIPLSETLSSVWDQMSEEHLVKLRGSLSSERPKCNKAQRGAAMGIGKRVIRRRKGDMDMRQEMLAQQLSYKHTKTWNTMVQEWMATFKAIEPSYGSIIIIGGILTGMLVMFAFFAMTMLIAAG